MDPLGVVDAVRRGEGSGDDEGEDVVFVVEGPVPVGFAFGACVAAACCCWCGGGSGSGRSACQLLELLFTLHEYRSHVFFKATERGKGEEDRMQGFGGFVDLLGAEAEMRAEMDGAGFHEAFEVGIWDRGFAVVKIPDRSFDSDSFGPCLHAVGPTAV